MPKAICILLSVMTLLCHDVNGQSSDSALTKNHHVKRWRKSAWIIPTSLIVTGSVLAANKSFNESLLTNHGLQEERNEHFGNFRTHVDNYLQFAPAAATFGLSLCGVKAKNNLANQTALFLKTEIIMTAIVFPTKKIVGEKRPDTNARNSFPSGHTAQAFAAATFLAKEYGHRSVWYPIIAYTTATGVAALRVLNNRHWLSDVVAGAGVGILSANIAYATHKYKWGKKHKNNLTVAPTYGSRTAGIYLHYRF